MSVLTAISFHARTASLSSQPIEADATRRRLAAHCGNTAPQMVLRIGYGIAPAPTPRRPVEEVTLGGPVRDLRP